MEIILKLRTYILAVCAIRLDSPDPSMKESPAQYRRISLVLSSGNNLCSIGENLDTNEDILQSDFWAATLVTSQPYTIEPIVERCEDTTIDEQYPNETINILKIIYVL